MLEESWILALIDLPSPARSTWLSRIYKRSFRHRTAFSFPFSSSIVSATPPAFFKRTPPTRPHLFYVISLSLVGAICDYILFCGVALFWRSGHSASASSGVYDTWIRAIDIYKEFKYDMARRCESYGYASLCGQLFYQQRPLSAPAGRGLSPRVTRYLSSRQRQRTWISWVVMFNFLMKQSFYSTLSVEQPTYLYKAIEFKNSISSLPGLLQKARNQEQEDEWLRVLQCTVYLIKIELKATEEIIAGVTDDAVINSRE